MVKKNFPCLGAQALTPEEEWQVEHITPQGFEFRKTNLLR